MEEDSQFILTVLLPLTKAKTVFYTAPYLFKGKLYLGSYIICDRRLAGWGFRQSIPNSSLMEKPKNSRPFKKKMCVKGEFKKERNEQKQSKVNHYPQLVSKGQNRRLITNTDIFTCTKNIKNVFWATPLHRMTLSNKNTKIAPILDMFYKWNLAWKKSDTL